MHLAVRRLKHFKIQNPQPAGICWFVIIGSRRVLKTRGCNSLLGSSPRASAEARDYSLAIFFIKNFLLGGRTTEAPKPQINLAPNIFKIGFFSLIFLL